MKEFLLLPAVGGIFIFMYEMLKKFDAFCDANRQNLWLEEDAVPEEKEESAEQVMDDCLSSSVSAERNGRLEKLLAAFQREKKVQNFRDLFTSILILLAASVMGYFFNSLGFANANIMTVFVFAVQLIAVLTNHRTYSMIAAVLSVLIFNFLFTTPRYTFHAYGEGYPVTFLIMFGIAFLTGTLALKLKNQAKQSEMVAFRTKILFDTNQILQCARGREEIISKTGQQLRKLLGRNVIFYSVKDHELEKSKVFMMEDREWSEQQKLKKEKADLLSAYPDNDNWLNNAECGDILSLADKDYIDKCVQNGYFTAGTPQELASFVYYVNTQPVEQGQISLVLTADIDLSDYKWAPMGWSGGGNSDHPFSFCVYGENHKITYMTIYSDYSNAGFIGWGTVCGVFDLDIENAIVTGDDNVGILTGQAIMGNYQNCHVSGTVNGSSAGSLLGYEANCDKENCTADVEVNGKKFDFLSWNEQQKSEIK